MMRTRSDWIVNFVIVRSCAPEQKQDKNSQNGIDLKVDTYNAPVTAKQKRLYPLPFL